MLDKIKSVKQKYGIVGNSDPLNHAIQVAIQVAPTDMTVLIIGESGSGKESFSKFITFSSSFNNFSISTLTFLFRQFSAINSGSERISLRSSIRMVWSLKNGLELVIIFVD